MKKILSFILILSLNGCVNFKETKESATQPNLNFKVLHVHPSKSPKAYGHKASTLLISCIDFRMRDEVEKLMELIGLQDKYDEVVLPGASIAVAGEKFPHWGIAAQEIIKVAKDLHDTKQVIILDHKDCGAFKGAYGKDKMSSPANEKNAHLEQMKKAVAVIKQQFPELKVYVYIMAVDGIVENWTDKL